MSNLYEYLMVSRNKDNAGIEGFKTRTKTIVEYAENEEKVIKKFMNFVDDGVKGEQSRLYRSVNSRNEEKIREELMIRLLRDKPSVTKLNQTLASVALQTCNRDESKWMFDFDVDDKDLAEEFVSDILSSNQDMTRDEILSQKTPNGYAIVVPHGFDTTYLMNHWRHYDITLKRDDFLFLDIVTKQ